MELDYPLSSPTYSIFMFLTYPCKSTIPPHPLLFTELHLFAQCHPYY